MTKSWRGRSAPRETNPTRLAEPTPSSQPELAITAPGARGGRPSWRYRMLLLAIGSATPDGSDVTDSDRDLLLRMDLHLARCAATDGEGAAQQALLALVEILKADPETPAPQMH